MDSIGRDYLLLALNIDRHFEGFVDAYFGPDDLRAKAGEGQPRSLERLRDDARHLQSAVEACDCDPQRKDFLTRQVRAMTAVVRNLTNDRLAFVDEVELYFDITPEMVSESVFETAQAEMDQLLPGDGELGERFRVWKEGLQIDPDRVEVVSELVLRESRRRTLDLFELPAGECVTLQLVRDQPWSAYNWYLGRYRSRIDLNTDLPVRVSFLLPLLAHEAYPGHHTEHAIKEQRLYREAGRLEHAIQLLLAPECVLSEGIADSALDMIFGEAELVSFLRDELYPAAGLDGGQAELQVRIGLAAEGLSGLGGNAALLLHRDRLPPDEVQSYVERWGLRTPKEAAQTMKFVQNPLFRSYIFNYSTGKALLAPLLKGAEATGNFRRLLSAPFTPSQVRDWIAGTAYRQGLGA